VQSPATQNIREIHTETEHEKVVLWSDERSGYRGIIAIHSTALGPAVGGTRFWNYESDELATLDALRLSRGMSYKNTLAGLPFGGGKSVIIGDHRRQDREQIFRAHGRFVEMLGGKYITGEDVGTTPADMEVVSRETRYVGGLPAKSGNPSPKTAFGVFRAMQACAMQRWGTDDMSGRTVAIQGCGSTGYYLAENLHAAGARLIVCDVDPASVRKVADQFGAKTVEPLEIFAVEADVFAPCALGGILNNETIPRLKVEIVVGSANNQLLDNSHGETLAQLGILYAPDYVANSGGIINGCRELLGWNESDTTQKISGIYERMQTLLGLAEREGIPPFKAADALARKLIADATPVKV
jgi:leucine dehydrogenase